MERQLVFDDRTDSHPKEVRQNISSIFAKAGGADNFTVFFNEVGDVAYTIFDIENAITNTNRHYEDWCLGNGVPFLRIITSVYDKSRKIFCQKYGKVNERYFSPALYCSFSVERYGYNPDLFINILKGKAQMFFFEEQEYLYMFNKKNFYDNLYTDITQMRTEIFSWQLECASIAQAQSGKYNTVTSETLEIFRKEFFAKLGSKYCKVSMIAIENIGA